MEILRTQRLMLRRLGLADAPFMLRLLNEPSFLENIGDRGVRTPLEAEGYIVASPMRSYEQYGFGVYLVEEIASSRAVGICGLIRREGLADVDLGFAFVPEVWGRGYASESGAAVLRYGREVLGLGRIVAITARHNLASKAVLRRMGFVYEGLIRLPGDDEEIELFASEPAATP